MYNLLIEPLIQARMNDGTALRLPLPEIYQAMLADQVVGFPELRVHQQHAWHAFLAQLAVVVLQDANWDIERKMIPDTSEKWREILAAYTRARGFKNDEPWQLVVDNLAQPAFMQCPDPDNLKQHNETTRTPDDLDWTLVTARNHEVKRGIAATNSAGDWIFALLNLQTTVGYSGTGNYGIVRMNGGYSSRPCVGLVPARRGLGGHLIYDIRRMARVRSELIMQYRYRAGKGLALIWLEPWSGTEQEQLSLQDLDPYFIEISRRVRIRQKDGNLFALRATSEKARIDAKEAHGNVGDFWTPVEHEGDKQAALSISPASLRYANLAKILFGGNYQLPGSMRPDLKVPQWNLLARGLAGGQGKTEGWYERSGFVLSDTVARKVFLDKRESASELANLQIKEIKQVNDALCYAIALASAGGERGRIRRADRTKAGPYSRQLDDFADFWFFTVLEKRFSATSSEDRKGHRDEFARNLISEAERLLEDALKAIPCGVIHHYQSSVTARDAFNRELRSNKSVLNDIFESGKGVSND